MSKIQNIDSHIIADIAERIERLITNARTNVARAINITEVITKYEIGRIIVNVVQEGEERATYGQTVIERCIRGLDRKTWRWMVGRNLEKMP